MSSDNLNPGASSFTPGGSAASTPPTPTSTSTAHASSKQDSFRVYEEMMDTIESEFEATEMDDLSAGMNMTFVGEQGAGALVDSSLPPHLAHQAAEFWFPECRDCTCCSGFKHACTCGGEVCKCSSSSASPVVVGSSLRPAPAGRGHGGRGGSGRGTGRGGGTGKIPCKFLQSPQGCRFGDQCRFAHV